MTGHATRAHALLGASKADQWINCPPSARAQEGIPDKRSEYADEGTAAHELSELIIERTLFPCNSATRKRLDTAIKKFKSENKYYNSQMEESVQRYVDVVAEKFTEAKAKSVDAQLLIEQRLDFSEWVPEGYGTGDVCIIADGALEIIDLKYGKGVMVSAVSNPQLRLYGLGAWTIYNLLYAIDVVRMTIVQPRLDSVSTDELPIDDLLAWAREIVVPAAALADAGEGDFKSGSHCKWCKIKANCRARADENMKLLAYEFKESNLLTLEEIGSILPIAEQLTAWAKDVQEYAFDQAKRGSKIPHHKLVEGRSNRSISDKELAMQKFAEAGVQESLYIKRDLYGITDLESKVGKKEVAAAIGDLIIKPPGKPVLVSETDKRQELNSVAGDFANEDFG